DEPAARVLFPLYNVRYALRNAGAPAVLPSVPSAVPPPRPPASWRVAMEPLAPTAGPAWFSERTQAAGSVQDLAERLRGLETDVVGRLRSVAWVVDTDPAARALPPAGECGAAAVTAVQATAAGTITVSVDGARDCPLTIATTFAESLRGRARVAGAWRDARLFPVYGALLGAWVPEGATEVVIAPR
ncbi:MAG TPA: hypothetical protein VFO85_10205, partial [Vicinamibacteria bacterium]|nr:hypothetical protein [Vicinamibacteria bacterium]